MRYELLPLVAFLEMLRCRSRCSIKGRGRRNCAVCDFNCLEQFVR